VEEWWTWGQGNCAGQVVWFERAGSLLRERGGREHQKDTRDTGGRTKECLDPKAMKKKTFQPFPEVHGVTEKGEAKWMRSCAGRP